MQHGDVRTRQACGRVLGGGVGVVPALATLAFLVTASPAGGQETAADRYRRLRPETRVTDDPRRIPVPPQPSGPPGAIVLRGGRIFDGTGVPARAGTLVIERNAIKAVLPSGAHEWPADARVLDVTGSTVLPGLIDLHTHVSYTDSGVPQADAVSDADAALRGVERLRVYIESGITSIKDVGSHNDVPFRLREWVAERRLPGPRIFPVGRLITGTGGHGAETLGIHSELYGSIVEAAGPWAWREAVRENFKRGAVAIKIASHFAPEEVKAAVAEAHALGLKVTCDCETFYVDWAVDAGVDIIEHPLPRTDEAIRTMAQRGVASVPTLIPYSYIFDLSGGYWGSTSRRFAFSKADNLKMLRRLKEAGVKIGVGTDLVFDWFRYLPGAYISELNHFVQAGYTPAEALVAATKTSAEILDMGHRLGTLERGKLADVLVVRGEPDRRLDDLAKVHLVIRDGEVVVEGGRVVVPRHEPRPEPRAGGRGEWRRDSR